MSKETETEFIVHLVLNLPVYIAINVFFHGYTSFHCVPRALTSVLNIL